MRRTRTVLAAVLTALLAFTLLAPNANAAGKADVEYVSIPGHDDVEIKAKVITPTGHEGPHPLIVMPSAWATNNLVYVGAAKKLAYESGYQVISYTSRGFWDSGGQIEVAGAKDVADAGKVIDWGLENTDADPERIGMGAISYGAGISLLTAAADDRVKAVGAMSGWADLGSAFYPNETISFQAIELLVTTAKLTGRSGEALRQIESHYREGDMGPALEHGPERSPGTKLDQLNENGPAIMLAHAWNDGVFPPSQITDFYSQLTVPKRLMISPGAHGTAEAFGAFGLPNETWESLTQWFDHHLKGVDNGVDTEDPVRVKPNNGSGDWSTHPDWESVTTETSTLHLGKPRRTWEQWLATGGLEEDPQSDWDYTVRSGIGTTANSGTLIVSGALQQFADLPTGVFLPLVDRYRAGVWTGEAYPDSVRVSGAPEARVTVTPTSENQSLYFYLYATNSHGVGSLLTHKPYTLRDATPGEPVTAEVDLEPVVWDVPAGHRLTLVVDTQDLRYTSESDFGERVEFSSPEEAPSMLTVPTS